MCLFACAHTTFASVCMSLRLRAILLSQWAQAALGWNQSHKPAMIGIPVDNTDYIPSLFHLKRVTSLLYTHMNQPNMTI